MKYVYVTDTSELYSPHRSSGLFRKLLDVCTSYIVHNEIAQNFHTDQMDGNVVMEVIHSQLSAHSKVPARGLYQNSTLYILTFICS